MSDNTTLPGTGDVVRDLDRNGVKTQVMAVDVGGQTGERILSSDNPMPVADARATDASQVALDILSSPAQRNGDESVTLVAMHPDFPLVLDPQQVLPVGGRTKAGTLMPQAADINGAQLLSDAPTLVTGQGLSATRLDSILFTVDTQGYRSLSVQLFGTWVGTVSFLTSNTGQDWGAVAGWNIAASQVPVTSTTANGTWVIPCVGRYIKIQVTAYTSGTVLGAAYLRNQPVPPLATTPNVNVAQVVGTAVVTAGVGGMQAVGGNIAPGNVATAYPINVGGVDATNKTRRFLTDASGNQYVVTPPANAATNPFLVRTEQSNQADDGVTDVLGQILRELKYHGFILQQLPLFLNQGLSQVDEVQQFRDDPSLQLN